MDVVFATSNKHKAMELSHLIGFKVKMAKVELDELQALSVRTVAAAKVKEAYKKVNKPVVVDDTGIHIASLNGFPGAFAKWFVEGLGHEGICRLMDRYKSRDAYAETCIAFCDGKIVKVFSGRVRGTIALHPRGNANLRWDSIFIPKGYKKTFGEMTTDEKSKISMRGIAVHKLKRFLELRHH